MPAKVLKDKKVSKTRASGDYRYAGITIIGSIVLPIFL